MKNVSRCSAGGGCHKITNLLRLSLSASRAYMFKIGYRASSAESHKTVWSFMLLSLSEEHHDRIHFFNRMRIKRNKNLYDHAGLISETEGRQIIRLAAKHIAAIKKII
ncbi:MAG: hypothetical protein DRP78_05285 [Candidatus Omnitrophota bacterium]|nr:MAG: hypothetical protein DRP78_05285 [Candidatus Omnitrophota bacterium]